MRLALLLALACGNPEAPPPKERVYRLDSPGPPEVWRDGEALAFFDGERLWRAEGELRAIQRWPSLGQVLTSCIGDPLRDPPARDPGAFRKLVWGETASWRVELSGANRCGIRGVLILNARLDSHDPKGLIAGEQAWLSGGEQAARRLLAAELRAEALRQWPTLPLAERILVLHRLELDPDPDAERALREIAALGDENAVDARNALERRAAGLSGD